MSIPKFEDAVRTQWFHDDQSFVHELTVQFNAGFRQGFPSGLTGEVCERAQHECVERLRRNVHESAAGTCHDEGTFKSWGLFTCSNCHSLVELNAVHVSEHAICNRPLKFCPNCGARIEVGA